MICSTGLTVPSELATWVIETSFVRPAQQRGELVENELAAIVHGRDAQHGASLLGEKLPRDDVGVVLDRG